MSNSAKKNSWPPRAITATSGVCCATSVWVFANVGGQWYASTFEYLRPGQTVKKSNTVSGTYIKRPPFLGGGTNWRPSNGEFLGFMVSGLARFSLGNVNVAERSNVFCLRWNEGPVPCGAGGGSAPPPSFDFAGTLSGYTSLNGIVSNFSEEITATMDATRAIEFDFDGTTVPAKVQLNGKIKRNFDFPVSAGCSVTAAIDGRVFANDSGGTTMKGLIEGEGSCSGNRGHYRARFTADSESAVEFEDGVPLPVPPAPTVQATINSFLFDENEEPAVE